MDWYPIRPHKPDYAGSIPVPATNSFEVNMVKEKEVPGWFLSMCLFVVIIVAFVAGILFRLLVQGLTGS